MPDHLRYGETLTDYYRPALSTRVDRILLDSHSVNHCWIITQASNFHPWDYQWPDQPGDHGTLDFEQNHWHIDDCRLAATSISEPADQPWFLGTDIPVKRGETGWTFCIAHRLNIPADKLSFEVGCQVTLRFDEGYRQSLNRGHSACHLMSLALNQALTSHWRKPIAQDACGNPDFDRLAISESSIEPNGSRDHYRLGKSLRKKGFDRQTFIDQLANIEDSINHQLQNWIAQGNDIKVEREPLALLARRYWHCKLDGVSISIPCGGTHCDNLSQLRGLEVRLQLDTSGDHLTVITQLPDDR
ncbi:hypothetical protein MIB92_16340 [Aestuariirhabdus sp. Z084]|uniref:hypothetical protein n=1 Tax=Aestuariirhabdus haliotis TaxID=2918751 RepID=UPI00201B3AC5|nr:hypothetical protein [Aestuariirhabdus haliotis]MCL6417231.1 hypothetical protein [Aestuariirhabdus haliotis]MCL6421204.1 hypothetical protein [Aestuariirhabdus haliotis]